MARLHILFFVETLLAHKYAASLFCLSCSVYMSSYLELLICLPQVLPSVNVFTLGIMFHLQLHYSHSLLHILLHVSLNHGVHSETMLANPDQIAENFSHTNSDQFYRGFYPWTCICCIGLFDSTLVKMPLCRKSHVTAQILSISFNSFHTG